MTPAGKGQWRDLVALGLFLLLSLAVSGLGGAITATSVGGWYQDLQKPAFNPPDWVFAPVWTALFITMAVAAWRIWRRGATSGVRRELTLYGLQLALNLGWSALFFGLQEIGWALVEILVLLAAIAATTVLFWRRDRLAGLLFLPYLAWVAYATLLTAALWTLNGPGSGGG